MKTVYIVLVGLFFSHVVCFGSADQWTPDLARQFLLKLPHNDINRNVGKLRDIAKITKDDPELARLLIDRGGHSAVLFDLVLILWPEHPELFMHLLNQVKQNIREYKTTFGQNDPYLAFTRIVLSDPASVEHPEWVEFLLKQNVFYGGTLGFFLLGTHWQTHPKWQNWAEFFFAEVLSNPIGDRAVQMLRLLASPAGLKLSKRNEWVKDLVASRFTQQPLVSSPFFDSFAEIILGKVQYANPIWMSLAAEYSPAGQGPFSVLRLSHWTSHPDWKYWVEDTVRRVLANGNYEQVIRFFNYDEFWKRQDNASKWLLELIQLKSLQSNNGRSYTSEYGDYTWGYDIGFSILGTEFWEAHPDFQNLLNTYLSKVDEDSVLKIFWTYEVRAPQKKNAVLFHKLVEKFPELYLRVRYDMGQTSYWESIKYRFKRWKSKCAIYLLPKYK